MADRRKLQNEIDRTLKKVDEGVKLFQDLWEKVQNAPNPNQKEKFESELKKEIKKLQRLRDQIKTWITSGDIKDKKALLEARKLIEAQMERFKVVEKETKTKAYSKEGLGSVQKMDPLQREREELIGWLSNSIDSLKVHMDTCESELELLQVASKKKKLEREKQERVDKLKYSLERHSYHIGRLETIMRLLDNEAIDIEQVKRIKEDVDYYVKSNGDPDFQENEEMYDELDIDESVIPDAASVGGMASTNTDDGDDMGSPLALTSSGGLGGSLANNIGGTGTTNSHSPPSSSNSPSPTPSLTAGPPQNSSSKQARSSTGSTLHRHNSGGSGGPGSATSNQNSAPRPQMSITPLKQSQNDVHGSSGSGVPERSSSVGPLGDTNSQQYSNTVPTGAQVFPYNFAAVAAQAQSSNGPSARDASSEHSPHSLASSQTSSSLLTSPADGSRSEMPEIVIKSGSGVGGLLTTAPSGDPAPAATTNPAVSFAFKASQSVYPPATSQAGRSPSHSQAAALFAAVSSQYTNSLPGSWSASEAGTTATSVVGSLLPPSGVSTTANTVRSARISARQGISPLGKVQLRQEQMWQRKMVEAALSRVPLLGDSERVRHYLPRQPCASPVYYPSQAIDSSSSLDFYKRLNVDSLFFVFYFMEGTKAQLLAAQALKDLAWRFHTRELTWFQRAETPKEVTETHEMGTYLYFDTQRWQTRKRENFRFEYQFLEDRNLQSYLEAAEATAQAAIAANSASALMMAAATNQSGAPAPSNNGPASSALTGTGTASINATVQQTGQQAVAAGGRK